MSDKYVRCYCSECKENSQGYNVLTKRTYQERERVEISKKIKETCELELNQQPSTVDVNDEIDGFDDADDMSFGTCSDNDTDAFETEQRAMEYLLNPAQNVHLPKSPVASLLFALLVLMRKN
ncbi:hypothetical protein A0J61_10337 [Choanephora cucurbitarum]|uniref:Uncharacterized protein n=1 Tax=Choanephora cucurbitarum TaxID=101091 RepID=A0A1C7MXQ8_9FUNG|nr:hypothetical protein A0J61_10337 [Choanephora cucurbitarum]